MVVVVLWIGWEEEGGEGRCWFSTFVQFRRFIAISFQLTIFRIASRAVAKSKRGKTQILEFCCLTLYFLPHSQFPAKSDEERREAKE